MSQVYATEPSTSGRVVLDTTHGPLEMQLWCRECPTTTRFFLQLCLDGFFDNMIFHRIVPDFLIQTGASRRSGSGGSSLSAMGSAAPMVDQYRAAVEADEALQRRKYEVHSRLRFNHRGQVAMALGVNDEDDTELQPQFFVTLDEAPYLDGKHVLFGTITGPTIFNAIRLGKTLVDDNTHQPADLQDAPYISSVKIVENPIFTDLVLQALIPWRQEDKREKPKKKKRKGKKDVNVLSFGDELEEELGQSSGIYSSHDVLPSATMGKQVDEQVRPTVTRDQTIHTQSEKNDPVIPREPIAASSTSTPPTEVYPKLSEQGPSKQLRHPAKEPEESILQEPRPAASTSIVEERRAKYKKRSSGSKVAGEDETMSKLFAFQRKVRRSVAADSHAERTDDDSLAARMMKKAEGNKRTLADEVESTPTYHGQVLNDDNGDDIGGSSWMKTTFKCRKHMDHTVNEDRRGGDGRDMDDYVVLDEKRRQVGRHGHNHKRRKHDSAHRGHPKTAN